MGSTSSVQGYMQRDFSLLDNSEQLGLIYVGTRATRSLCVLSSVFLPSRVEPVKSEGTRERTCPQFADTHVSID
jgi:hypothetical protein